MSVRGWGETIGNITFNLVLNTNTALETFYLNLSIHKLIPNKKNQTFSIYKNKPNGPFLFFQHHPGHINGLILLADINVNHLKNLDVAEEVISFFFFFHFRLVDSLSFGHVSVFRPVRNVSANDKWSRASTADFK